MKTTKSSIISNVHLRISAESSTKKVRVFNLLLQLGPAADQLRKQERGRSKLDSRSRRMETNRFIHRKWGARAIKEGLWVWYYGISPWWRSRADHLIKSQGFMKTLSLEEAYSFRCNSDSRNCRWSSLKIYFSNCVMLAIMSTYATCLERRNFSFFVWWRSEDIAFQASSGGSVTLLNNPSSSSLNDYIFCLENSHQ